MLETTREEEGDRRGGRTRGRQGAASAGRGAASATWRGGGGAPRGELQGILGSAAAETRTGVRAGDGGAHGGAEAEMAVGGRGRAALGGSDAQARGDGGSGRAGRIWAARALAAETAAEDTWRRLIRGRAAADVSDQGRTCPARRGGEN